MAKKPRIPNPPTGPHNIAKAVLDLGIVKNWDDLDDTLKKMLIDGSPSEAAAKKAWLDEGGEIGDGNAAPTAVESSDSLPEVNEGALESGRYRTDTVFTPAALELLPADFDFEAFFQSGNPKGKRYSKAEVQKYLEGMGDKADEATPQPAAAAPQPEANVKTAENDPVTAQIEDLLNEADRQEYLGDPDLAAEIRSRVAEIQQQIEFEQNNPGGPPDGPPPESPAAVPASVPEDPNSGLGYPGFLGADPEYMPITAALLDETPPVEGGNPAFAGASQAAAPTNPLLSGLTDDPTGMPFEDLLGPEIDVVSPDYRETGINTFTGSAFNPDVANAVRTTEAGLEPIPYLNPEYAMGTGQVVGPGGTATLDNTAAAALTPSQMPEVPNNEFLQMDVFDPPQRTQTDVLSALRDEVPVGAFVGPETPLGRAGQQPMPQVTPRPKLSLAERTRNNPEAVGRLRKQQARKFAKNAGTKYLEYLKAAPIKTAIATVGGLTAADTLLTGGMLGTPNLIAYLLGGAAKNTYSAAQSVADDFQEKNQPARPSGGIDRSRFIPTR